MKTTRVDKLGRIVIPIGYRRKLGLKEGTSVVININGAQITVCKEDKLCIICGNVLVDNITPALCKECVKKVKALP